MTSLQYFNLQSLIFYSLLLGQIVFGCMCLFLVSTGGGLDPNPDSTKIFTYVVPTFSVASILLGRFVFRIWIRRVIERPLNALFKEYQAANIVRWAIIEGGALLAFVLFLLSGQYLFFYFACFSLYFFFSHRPTLDKMVIDLNLEPQVGEKLAQNTPISQF